MLLRFPLNVSVFDEMSPVPVIIAFVLVPSVKDNPRVDTDLETKSPSGVTYNTSVDDESRIDSGFAAVELLLIVSVLPVRVVLEISLAVEMEATVVDESGLIDKAVPVTAEQNKFPLLEIPAIRVPKLLLTVSGISKMLAEVVVTAKGPVYTLPLTIAPLTPTTTELVL